MFQETVSKDDVTLKSDLHIAVIGNVVDPNDIVIILEGSIAMEGITDFGEAMILLMELIYALDLQYPQKCETTFDFIQKVIIKLDETEEKKPKVQTLRRKLYE